MHICVGNANDIPGQQIWLLRSAILNNFNQSSDSWPSIEHITTNDDILTLLSSQKRCHSILLTGATNLCIKETIPASIQRRVVLAAETHQAVEVEECPFPGWVTIRHHSAVIEGIMAKAAYSMSAAVETITSKFCCQISDMKRMEESFESARLKILKLLPESSHHFTASFFVIALVAEELVGGLDIYDVRYKLDGIDSVRGEVREILETFISGRV